MFVSTRQTLQRNISLWIDDAVAQGLGSTVTSVSLPVSSTFSKEGVEYNSTYTAKLEVSAIKPTVSTQYPYVKLWVDSSARKLWRLLPDGTEIEVLDFGRVFTDEQGSVT